MKYFKFSVEDSENVPFVLLKRKSENEIRSAYNGKCFIREISEKNYNDVVMGNTAVADRFEDRFSYYCQA